jgi:N-acetylmuramate 1-kinase
VEQVCYTDGLCRECRVSRGLDPTYGNTMPTTTHAWLLEDLDEPALENAAGWLSLVARPGDFITLEGDLGAGKTTFARAFIRAASGEPELEVPSPTFPIVQDYELPRFALIHADLYRLGSTAEVLELGLLEDTDRRVTLVEWPDRAAGLLPGDRIAVTLDDAHGGERRTVRIIGSGTAAPRLARLEKLAAFAIQHGWPSAPVYIFGDASVRAYARLVTSDRPGAGPALLMDSPAPPAGPPLASGKTYRQIVHSADDIGAFFAVSRALRAAGLSAPAVLAADRAEGHAHSPVIARAPAATNSAGARGRCAACAARL